MTWTWQRSCTTTICTCRTPVRLGKNEEFRSASRKPLKCVVSDLLGQQILYPLKRCTNQEAWVLGQKGLAFSSSFWVHGEGVDDGPPLSKRDHVATLYLQLLTYHRCVQDSIKDHISLPNVPSTSLQTAHTPPRDCGPKRSLPGKSIRS